MLSNDRFLVLLGTMAAPRAQMSHQVTGGLREGDRLELQATAVPQIVRRADGAVLSETAYTFRTEGTIRNGVAVVEAARPDRDGPLASPPLDAPA